MRKTLFIAWMFICTLSAQAQNVFTIEGTVKGVEDGTVLRLNRSEGNIIALILSDTVRNGKFHFQGETLESAPECLLLTSNDKGFPSIWMDVWVAPKSKIAINGTNKLLQTWKATSSLKEQKDLNRYVDATRGLLDERQELMIKIRDLFESIETKKSSEAEKKAGRDEVTRLYEQMNKITIQKDSVEIKIAQKTPISTVWMEKLKDFSSDCKYIKDFPYKKEVVELYNRLSKVDKMTDIGKEITATLFPPKVIKEGEEMAEADLYDLEGKIHHFADYKGKFIMIDFWSRGCGPCIMSLPEIKEITEMYKDRLTVISLSTDNEKNWKDESKSGKITGLNFNDLQGTNGLHAKYGGRGLPHYVLISPEGKVMSIWSGYGPGSLKMKLRKPLSKKPEMIVSQSGGTKIVDYPTETSSNTEIVEIKRVELSDTATVVRIKSYYAPKNWIQFSGDVHLKADNGTLCPLKQTIGIKTGERFFMPESGEAEFTFIFAPLPTDAKSFDFTEGDSEGSWQVRGLALTKP